jgi:hypothetical protein
MWCGIVLALAILFWLIALVMILFDSAAYSDKLAAFAAILGGALGATGAALAVYLTIQAPRSDEAERWSPRFEWRLPSLAGLQWADSRYRRNSG